MGHKDSGGLLAVLQGMEKTEAQISKMLQRRNLGSSSSILHCLSWGLAYTSLPLGGFEVGWREAGPSLHGLVPSLAAGFWRNKFDPSLTQQEPFHLDEQFTVPVDMMQAHAYPLRWFLLEQPEIQVTPRRPAGSV